MFQINMFTVCGSLKEFVNNSFQGKEPWQIVTITSTTLLTTIWLWNFIFQDESKIVSISYVHIIT